MQIDWITVSAQIINFLILVWLLKHFLYQPIMHAMSRREQNIAYRLNEAERREQNADEKEKLFEDKSHDLDQKRDKLLEDARIEADKIKRKMIDGAREEVADMRKNWLQQLEEEKKEFIDNLRQQTIETIQATARTVLNDLANANLEEQIIDKFLAQLKTLDKLSHDTLTKSSGPLKITTSFKLDIKQRNVLTKAVNNYLEKGRELEYVQSPALGCGIEISNGGRRLAWHISDYMDDLTSRINGSFSFAGKMERLEA